MIEISKKYGYSLKHKVVVYGGHATWLKAIQPLLKNVKFILKDMKPTTEQMRNADMIWVQRNAFCHSFFSKVRNVASAHNIPLHYFSYASAQMCAEQLVDVDKSLS